MNNVKGIANGQLLFLLTIPPYWGLIQIRGCVKEKSSKNMIGVDQRNNLSKKVFDQREVTRCLPHLIHLKVQRKNKKMRVCLLKRIKMMKKFAKRM